MKLSFDSVIKGLVRFLSYLVAILASAAIAYGGAVSFGVDWESAGFRLATISAVIGGLVLAAGLLDKWSSDPDLSLSLRRIGTTYLVAALAFVVVGICSSFPRPWFFDIARPIGMLAGVLSFATGSLWLASKVPRLWSGS